MSLPKRSAAVGANGHSNKLFVHSKASLAAKWQEYHEILQMPPISLDTHAANGLKENPAMFIALFTVKVSEAESKAANNASFRKYLLIQ